MLLTIYFVFNHKFAHAQQKLLPFCTNTNGLVTGEIVGTAEEGDNEAICYGDMGGDTLFTMVEDEGVEKPEINGLPACEGSEFQVPEGDSCPTGTQPCYVPVAEGNVNVSVCGRTVSDEAFEAGEDETNPRTINLIEDRCEGEDCPSAEGVVCGPETVKTAIGCISTKPQDLIGDIVKLAVALGGGVALLLMIFGSIRMITSAGNQDQLKAGREQFVSAVIGLLFVIFAIVLMQIIGVDFLSIPGLNR